MIDTLSILGHYLRTRHRPAFHSRPDLEAWQGRRFQGFAADTLSRSPYFRPFVGKPLGAYPMMDKTAMLANFDRMNTRGLSRAAVQEIAAAAERSRDFTPTIGDIAVGLSSGTSGQRGVFAVSRAERRLYAGVILAKCLPDSILRRTRVALLFRANNRLYEDVGKSHRIEFRFHDLMQPLDRVFADLVADKPDVIIAPPQVLRLLADGVIEGRLKLEPRRIISAAEVLEPADGRHIAKAFKQPVHQVYQATEGFLSSTCRHGTLHLHEDFIIFERHWIDRESGRFMPIVTDFNRTTQPIVRYRLDDVLVERSTACACGSPLTAIDRIEGRFDDIIALHRRDSGRLVPVMPDFLRDALANCHAAIGDYRVIQTDAGHIDLRLDAANLEWAFTTARDALSAAFIRLGLQPPEFALAGPIDRDPCRKIRRIQRRFAIAAEDLCPVS